MQIFYCNYINIKYALICCFVVLYCNCFSQNSVINNSSFQAEYFYGNILKHNKNVGHFSVDHPTGILLSWNKKTFGEKEWQQRFNYPDYGFSFSYQDNKNEILGDVYSFYGHYNFYFLKRTNKNQFILRPSFGVGYNTNPYDKVTNPKNVAFGTKLNASVSFRLYYQRENIFKNVGINAGFVFMHTSNASFKSPNTGLNILGATIGMNYNLNSTTEIEYILEEKESEKINKKIKYNFELRSGANESDFINTGVKPFFVVAVYADKRLTKKSALQFGTELMVNYSLKDYMDLKEIVDESFEKGDFKRVGVFIGHELFINKLSIIGQLGYYAYYPINFESRIYQRVGFKYYFNEKLFGSFSLKTHAAKAETFSLGIGFRL